MDGLRVTLGEALRTGAFWVFALSSATYGLIASGIALFNESILAERGFDPATYHRTLAVTPRSSPSPATSAAAGRCAASRSARC